MDPNKWRSQNNHSWGVLGEALFGLLLLLRAIGTNFPVIISRAFICLPEILFGPAFPCSTMSNNRGFRAPIKRGRSCVCDGFTLVRNSSRLFVHVRANAEKCSV